MRNTKVTLLLESQREEICRLYTTGTGPVYIGKPLFGWTKKQCQNLTKALRRWGVYVPGKYKGGGWGKGLRIISGLTFRAWISVESEEIIVQSYRDEQRAAERYGEE